MKTCCDCYKEIRRGARCVQCALKMTTPKLDTGLHYLFCLLQKDKGIYIVYRGKSLEDVWRWLNKFPKRRKTGNRHWIQLQGMSVIRRNHVSI